MLYSVICKCLSIILHNSKSLKEYRNDIDMQYKVNNKYSNDEKYVMCEKTEIAAIPLKFVLAFVSLVFLSYFLVQLKAILTIHFD